MAVARLLLSFAVALQLLNLLLLIFDLPLLIVDLRLGLRLLILPILHLVADCVSAQCPDTAADCRARERIADRGADNRARRRADAGSDEGAFLTSREGFSRASHRHHERNRHEQAFNQRQRNRICPHGLSPFKREQFSCLPTAEDFLEPGSRLVYLAADSFLPYTWAINHMGSKILRRNFYRFPITMRCPHKRILIFYTHRDCHGIIERAAIYCVAINSTPAGKLSHRLHCEE
jgi:hypothetical protein